MKYNFTGDYVAKLNEIIDDLFKQAKQMPRDERMQLITEVTDQYVMGTGKRPNSSALDRMATLILTEELTDATPWKTRNTEYPIESDRQKKDFYSGLNGEIPETMASTKVDHRYPTRRERSWNENTHVNTRTKAENLERRRKYNAFKRGEIPGVLNVVISKGDVQ